jgi:photosystem II stability/assembly factor-like uncharacterized protein
MKRAAAVALAAGLALTPMPSSAAWQLQDSGTTNNLHSVNFDHSTAARAWACGENGTIVYTSDGGATWNQQESGTTVHLYGIVFHEENGTVIAVGEEGTILRTTNRGTTWTLIPSPTTVTLRDASDFRFYVVGDAGTILKSSDWGLNWGLIESGSTADLHSVIGLEPFPTAVGSDGVILRGDPTGTTWHQLNSDTAVALHGLPLFTHTLVPGDAGTILKTTNSGADWFQVASGTTQSLRSIADANGAVYIVGDGGTILKSTNNGNAWGMQTTPVLEDLNGSFFYLFPNVGYAVGDGGTILKTTDGGGAIVTAANPPSTDLQYPQLHASSPNPFRNTITLTYFLPRETHVSLRVLDVLGREAATLVDQVQTAGPRSVVWDASGFASGVYCGRLVVGDGAQTLRLIRIR